MGARSFARRGAVFTTLIVLAAGCVRYVSMNHDGHVTGIESLLTFMGEGVRIQYTRRERTRRTS